MFGPFLPQTVELTIQDGKLMVSVLEHTLHPTLIGVAFVDNNTPVKIPGRRTIPTPMGAGLWASGEPNCMMSYADGVHYLWTARDIYPREPLTIDDRLYHV